MMNPLRPLLAGRFALLRSSVWAIAEYVTYPLMMLAAMPLYLAALGDVQFGQWMLLLTITGFGGLAGLGMGPTATRMVAAASGRGDMHGASEAARACMAITLGSSIGLAVLILGVGWTFGGALFEKMGTPREIRMIVVFGAFLLTLEQIDAVIAGILRGFERFDLSARLEIGAKMFQVACSALVAWQTGRLLAVFITASLVAVARSIGKLVIARRLLPAGGLSPKWNPAEIRTAFGFGKWIWLQSAGSLMFAVADRALVGSLLGAEALARYAVALQLAQQVQTIPAAGAQVLFPAVAKRQEQGQNWRPLAIRAMAGVAALGMAGAAALLMVGPWFMEIWVGRSMAAEVAPVLQLLAITYGLMSLPSGAHLILLGAGHARLVAGLTVLAGAVAVAVMPWAIGQLGLAGAPWGRFAYALIVLAMIPAVFRTMRLMQLKG